MEGVSEFEEKAIWDFLYWEVLGDCTVNAMDEQLWSKFVVQYHFVRQPSIYSEHFHKNMSPRVTDSNLPFLRKLVVFLGLRLPWFYEDLKQFRKVIYNGAKLLILKSSNGEVINLPYWIPEDGLERFTSLYDSPDLQHLIRKIGNSEMEYISRFSYENDRSLVPLPKVDNERDSFLYVRSGLKEEKPGSVSFQEKSTSRFAGSSFDDTCSVSTVVLTRSDTINLNDSDFLDVSDSVVGGGSMPRTEFKPVVIMDNQYEQEPESREPEILLDEDGLTDSFTDENNNNTVRGMLDDSHSFYEEDADSYCFQRKVAGRETRADERREVHSSFDNNRKRKQKRESGWSAKKRQFAIGFYDNIYLILLVASLILIYVGVIFLFPRFLSKEIGGNQEVAESSNI